MSHDVGEMSPPEWELLIQTDCELCEEFTGLLAADGRLPLADIAITVLADRPLLHARYLFHVPVLLHHGQEVIAGRVSGANLSAVLDSILDAVEAPAI